MDYKVIWSVAAIADLHEICAYISRDHPQAALRVGAGSSAMSASLLRFH
jgi:plasmid stabilization system protein ParE